MGYDEFASAVELDGADGWRPIALKFLNALPAHIFASMRREWEDEEKRRGNANPVLASMNRVEIRTMALQHENTMATRAAEFRAIGLDAAKFTGTPPAAQPYHPRSRPIPQQAPLPQLPAGSAFHLEPAIPVARLAM